MLSNEVDRLGLDTNESGWTIAWVMECYEKGILSKDMLDGLEMNWGNIEAVRDMLHKIAKRQGFGNILAEGVMRAAQHVGGEALALGIYTKKGNTPRAHDHRSLWPMLLDTCVSDTGTDEAGPQAFRPSDLGLPVDINLFSAHAAAEFLARARSFMPLEDCLGICRFNIRGVSFDDIGDNISAATGWNFSGEETNTVGLRVVNLLRSFNIRHGLTAYLDRPSARYGSTPSDGPFQGKSSAPVWDEMLHHYYELMGWDVRTGKPLPDTLRKLGLDFVVTDLWQTEEAC